MFHSVVACYVIFLLWCIHVNITLLLNITCTLVDRCVWSFECVCDMVRCYVAWNYHVCTYDPSNMIKFEWRTWGLNLLLLESRWSMSVIYIFLDLEILYIFMNVYVPLFLFPRLIERIMGIIKWCRWDNCKHNIFQPSFRKGNCIVRLPNRPTHDGWEY